MNKNNHGRTFWDILSEHPKLTIFLILLLFLLIIIYLHKGYSIKLPFIEIENTTEAKNEAVEQKESEKLELDTQINVDNSPGSINTKDQIGDNIMIKPEGDVIINQSSKQRELTQELKNELDKKLPVNKNVQIKIVVLMGDQEARRFAIEIQKYIVSTGRKIDSFAFFQPFNKPFIGLSINPDGSIIRVGSTE